MGRLRHRSSPGATYFVTTKTWQNRSLFQVQELADVVVGKLLAYRDKGAYELHEFVLMPDHLHLMLTPHSSVSLEKVMQLIKGASSHEIRARRENKMEIWQPGFHETLVRSRADYQSRRHYIHMNPVHKRLSERPEEWPHCSASGRYSLDPIPQGLKPFSSPDKVGPKGPTPNTFSRVTNQ